MRNLRRDHPIFFWGSVSVLVLLLVATAAVAVRIPQYRSEAGQLNRQMDAQERATRDSILDARARRAELAVALIRHEARLKSLQESGLHLAISTGDSTLYLRQGAATLRAIPVEIGADSTVRSVDGRMWRFVRPLGERRVAEKRESPSGPIPEWVYVSRGEPVPPESAREVSGGLGRYVLVLDDGTEIYSRPSTGPLARGVIPGSFVVAEPEMQAIFAAIDEDTPVYIY
jgi:hypothetical protein